MPKARFSLPALISTVILLAGCGGSDVNLDASVMPDALRPMDDATTPMTDAVPPGPDAMPPGPPPTTIGTDARPARVVPPDDYDSTSPTPVIFLLHGYTASAEGQNFYFGLSSITAAMGIILVLPDGTIDRGGNRFWNADQRCCDFGGTGVDDVAYLTSLLDEIEAGYNVDTSRVYFYGHSNGGYMAYRMACDLGDRVTAIASLAGATRTNDADCARARPVSVLQIHGTADPTILFMSTREGHVGAVDGVERWASHAGCDLGMARMEEPRDFETAIGGAETTVRVYDSGCATGFVGEVWAIQGGGHVPRLRPPSTMQVVEWLLARGPVTTL